jgi:hypothetical protein
MQTEDEESKESRLKTENQVLEKMFMFRKNS